MQASFSLSQISLMAERRNPRPSTTKNHRAATEMSPISSCSDEDLLALSAVAYRRVAPTTVGDRRPDMIVELFENFTKLANENKINQKNCWALKLIDHISEVVKIEAENNDETQTTFQKASCAVEVGAKIYSARVDSLHSQTYRVLGGFNRAAAKNEQVMEDIDNHSINYQENHEQEFKEKISPLTTLESSFQALNTTKFNVASAVEPLNQQTFVLVNEGGSTGLLLNNLGIYGTCRVLFDYLEIPGKCETLIVQNEVLASIDLSFAKETIEQMMKNMSTENEICPTLEEIICLFDKETQCSRQPMIVDSFQTEFDTYNAFDDSGEWLVDHEEEDATFQIHQEHESNSYGFEKDDNFEKAPLFLVEHFGFTLQQNAWAGPDYWKYRNPKENISTSESMTTFSTKRNKKMKVVASDLEFASLIGKDVPGIFAPPRNTKSLLLPLRRSPRSNSLPEDCHYGLKDLLKFFLLPNIRCLDQQLQKHPGGNLWEEENYVDEALPSWDKESVCSGDFNYGDVIHDFENSDELSFQLNQVNQTKVLDQKMSKQVDVNILKEALWDQMQEIITKVPEMDSNNSISFNHLLATFPVDSHGHNEAPIDLSPHLLFICLLHLASDQGLIIHDCPSLDDLTIYLTSCEEDIRSF